MAPKSWSWRIFCAAWPALARSDTHKPIITPVQDQLFQLDAIRIIDLGGVIVGKQKTAQFASAAHTWEWSDVYYSENPRGDRMLSCSASSAGGGCSIAAYDWLDFAIGSSFNSSHFPNPYTSLLLFSVLYNAWLQK